jgi:hypothetical protein
VLRRIAIPRLKVADLCQQPDCNARKGNRVRTNLLLLLEIFYCRRMSKPDFSYFYSPVHNS